MRLSIPLMLGVSLVSADDWILRYFASGGAGDITSAELCEAIVRRAHSSILGQATGQASMPFFARLFGEGKRQEFGDTVNGSVFRISAASLLSTAWMMPAALPLIDLVYRRGRFTFQDSRETAAYFFWFALSLALWSAQALYARAFYAAGDTVTPMIASTIIVVASLPIYSAMYHRFDVPGLAMASDIGILMQHRALALDCSDRKKLVALCGLLVAGVAEVSWEQHCDGGCSLLRGESDGGGEMASRRTDLLSLAWISLAMAGRRLVWDCGLQNRACRGELRPL